jgi:pSer/pThr/pTyr-binding forkhead associated (FHA) protein
MPRLIIKLSHQQNVLFELNQEEVLIGRGDHADITLPNASVSREHARLRRVERGYTIEDLGSQNGIQVNGAPQKEHTLTSGDEVQIGRFQVVFLGDRVDDRFWRGRAVQYIPRYDKKQISARQDETFQLTPEMADRLKQDNQLLTHACVTLEGSTLFWYTDGNPLTFGNNLAAVRVEGWLVRGTVASIEWDGHRHTLTRQSAVVSAAINGQALKNKETAPLRPGSLLNIGGTTFRYDLKAS